MNHGYFGFGFNDQGACSRNVGAFQWQQTADGAHSGGEPLDLVPDAGEVELPNHLTKDGIIFRIKIRTGMAG